jgi:hypothetical protein
MGMKKFLLFAIFLVSLSFLISSVKAVTYISDCSNLDQEGETYYLTQDIIDSTSSSCINITSDYVILDCQGHIIDGVDALEASGITIHDRGYDGIKNCILTDWYYGILDIQINGAQTNLTNITFSSNTHGLYFKWGHVNIVKDSKFQNNEYGVAFYGGWDNLFYNNLFNNTYNCLNMYIQWNYWNTTRQIGTRIYSAGTEIGGNYWTNPAGNGYSDTCTDNDKDGFCDLPYDTGCGGFDYLPLSNKYSPPPEITVFSPLNQSYYGRIYFTFKAISYINESFIIRTYLNNQLDYENLNYSNNTQISYSKFLPMGTYNFTVYAKDVKGINSEVIFTSLGYCGDNVCQADYEKTNCPIDCNQPPLITIFLPLNQSYYGSIDFAFKAIDDFDENFTVKAYLNNQLEYENLYYQNNTQISYSKSLPMGTYNFTVYAEDSYGASSQQEVIFTYLGYCGDNVCQADYENNMNCFKDCGGTARQFTVGIGSVVLAFGGLMLLATAFASSPTEGKDYVFKVFVAVIGIILMVYGIIYLFNL